MSQSLVINRQSLFLTAITSTLADHYAPLLIVIIWMLVDHHAALSVVLPMFFVVFLFFLFLSPLSLRLFLRHG